MKKKVTYTCECCDCEYEEKRSDVKDHEEWCFDMEKLHDKFNDLMEEYNTHDGLCLHVDDLKALSVELAALSKERKELGIDPMVYVQRRNTTMVS